MLKILLLRARNGILADIEDSYALLGSHMNFAKREKLAQPSSRLAKDGTRQMLEGEDQYVVDTMILLIASFNDKRLGV